ncbi:hypothetical protein [Amycolatopsis japonica]
MSAHSVRAARALEELIDAARATQTTSLDDRDKREELLVRAAVFVVAVTPDRVEQFGRSNGKAVLATMAARLALADPTRADRLLAGVGKPWDRLTAVAMTERALAVAAVDPRRGRKLHREAERAVEQMNDWGKPYALADMAKVMAPTDPRRARRLLTWAAAAGKSIGKARGQLAIGYAAFAASAVDLRLAERIARSMVHPSRTGVLAEVVRAAAHVDPDHAEKIARSFTEGSLRASALADIAAAVSASDSQRADRLITDAEALSASIMTAREYQDVATALIKAIAARDPDRAAQQALRIKKETDAPWPMAVAAGAVAAAQPGRAERIARAITNDSYQNDALAAAAKGMAGVDPQRADLICRSIPDISYAKQRAMADTATAMVHADLDRAENLANTVTDARHKASALAEVLTVLTGNS